MRFPDSAEHSSERWKPLPKPSPDGRVVAVNDRSGRLWLLSATDGQPLLAYPRTLVNFVEDFAWGGDSLLYVIDNAGRVIRLEGTPARVVWSVDDAPEPDAAVEPDAPPMNIVAMTTNRVACASALTGMMVKPAVRNETASKTAANGR